jgi:hypothetical protein
MRTTNPAAYAAYGVEEYETLSKQFCWKWYTVEKDRKKSGMEKEGEEEEEQEKEAEGDTHAGKNYLALKARVAQETSDWLLGRTEKQKEEDQRMYLDWKKDWAGFKEWLSADGLARLDDSDSLCLYILDHSNDVFRNFHTLHLRRFCLPLPCA